MDVWSRAARGQTPVGCSTFVFETKVRDNRPSAKLLVPSGNRFVRFRVSCCKDEKEPDKDPAESADADLKSSIDWDRAWSSFKETTKKPTFFRIDMEQYVSRKPSRSSYPLSEEVNSFKKIEKQTLNPWNDLKFTYAGVGVIIGLFVYMVIIVGPPPT